MFTVTPVAGKTFAEELETAADLLRSGRSPIPDTELSGSVADLLDIELVRMQPGGQPTSAAIRTARAVATQTLLKEVRP